MKYIVEKPLKEFEFWSGAKQVADELTDAEFDQIEDSINDLFVNGEPTEIEINDFFWFDTDTIEDIIGRKLFDKDEESEEDESEEDESEEEE